MIGGDRFGQTKFERLHTKYKYLLLSIATKIVKDHHLAEDAVQHSFEKIFENLHKIDEKDEDVTRKLLAIICRNVSINIYNSKKVLDKKYENIDNMEVECSEFNPLNIVVDSESEDLIVKAIKGLPLTYSDVVLLKYHYDYSREEIAHLLELPLETVKKRLFRGRKILSKSLRREDT